MEYRRKKMRRRRRREKGMARTGQTVLSVKHSWGLEQNNTTCVNRINTRPPSPKKIANPGRSKDG